MILTGDLNENNLALELVAEREQKIVAKILYSGVASDFTISVFEQNSPVDVIERLISAARFALLPSTKVHGI